MEDIQPLFKPVRVSSDGFKAIITSKTNNGDGGIGHVETVNLRPSVTFDAVILARHIELAMQVLGPYATSRDKLLVHFYSDAPCIIEQTTSGEHDTSRVVFVCPRDDGLHTTNFIEQQKELDTPASKQTGITASNTRIDGASEEPPKSPDSDFANSQDVSDNGAGVRGCQ